MERNKNLIIFTFSLIFLIVIVATVLRVYNLHIDNQYAVVEKKISESAESCFLEEICKSNTTTLGFLIKNGYLEAQVNPITKEYISEDLVIEYVDGKCSVNIR